MERYTFLKDLFNNLYQGINWFDESIVEGGKLISQIFLPNFTEILSELPSSLRLLSARYVCLPDSWPLITAMIAAMSFL